jgi:hypothetical protein
MASYSKVYTVKYKVNGGKPRATEVVASLDSQAVQHVHRVEHSAQGNQVEILSLQHELRQVG